MYNDTVSSKIIKKITPTKWGTFKFFVKMGALALASSYYCNAVTEQMKINENGTILSSIEEVIKEQYQQIKDPFLNLLKRAEGYKEGFYADNKGYAVGYGYNPTQNSNQYNKSILDFAGVDNKTKEIVLNNSEKYKNQYGGKIPQELKDTKFTKEQLDKMAMYSQHTYERSFFNVLNHKLDDNKINGVQRIKLLNAYVDLPENKKAVLIHMTYKVGETNLEKYRNFFGYFIAYLDNPNDKNKEAVAQSFTYKYSKNGVMLHDTRVEKLHHDLFMQDMPKLEIKEPNKKLLNSSNKTTNKNENKSEQEKFNTAMKEVNNQITLNGALALIEKALTKVNDKFIEKNKNQDIKEVTQLYPEKYIQETEDAVDDMEEEEYQEYYESSEREQTITINGKSIKIR